MSWNKRLDNCFSNKTSRTLTSTNVQKDVDDARDSHKQYFPVQVIPKAAAAEEVDVSLENPLLGSKVPLSEANFNISYIDQLSDTMDPIKLVSSIVSDPKNYNSIFVSERSGRVRHVDTDFNMTDVFSMELGTDLAKSLQFTGPNDYSDDKRGLLGVEIDTVDPDWMWVTYTAHPDIQTMQFNEFEIRENHPEPGKHSVNSELFLKKFQDWALGKLTPSEDGIVFVIDLVGKSHTHTVEFSEISLKEILHTQNRSDFIIEIESSKTNDHSHTVTITFSPEQYDCFVCLARIKIPPPSLPVITGELENSPTAPITTTETPSTTEETKTDKPVAKLPLTLITPITYNIIGKYKAPKFNAVDFGTSLAITPVDYENFDKERWLYWSLGGKEKDEEVKKDDSTSSSSSSFLSSFFGKIWRVNLKTQKIEDAPYITGLKNSKSICFDLPSPVIYFSAEGKSMKVTDFVGKKTSSSSSFVKEEIKDVPKPPPRLAWTEGLYFTDSGDKWEEVNYSEKGGDAGWPFYEGPSKPKSSSSSSSSSLINPVGYYENVKQEDNDFGNYIVAGRVYRNWGDALLPFLSKTPSSDPLHGYFVALTIDGTLLAMDTRSATREGGVDVEESLQPLEVNGNKRNIRCMGQTADGNILFGTDFGISEFLVPKNDSTSNDVTNENQDEPTTNETTTTPTEIEKAPNIGLDDILRTASIDPLFNPYGNTPSPNYYPGSPYYPGAPYYPPYYPPQYDPNFPYYPPYVPPVPTDTLPTRCVDPSKCCVRAFITQASKSTTPSYQNRRMQSWEYEGHTVREEDLMYIEDWVNSGETKTSFTFTLNLFPSDFLTRNRGYYPDYPRGSNYPYINNNFNVYGGGHTHSIIISQYHIDKLRKGEFPTFRTALANSQYTHVHEVMLTCGQDPSFPIY